MILTLDILNELQRNMYGLECCYKLLEDLENYTESRCTERSRQKAIYTTKKRINYLEEHIQQVLDAVDQIHDDEIRTICYDHFVLNWTWQATAESMFTSSAKIRNTMNEYFNKLHPDVQN